MKVALTPDARRDRREAAAWYRRQSPQAVEDFIVEIRHALQFIAEYPLGGRAFHGRTRAKTLKRFPYTILYIVLAAEVMVVAVADERRDPEYYANRLS